jgi:hypothetical protein
LSAIRSRVPVVPPVSTSTGLLFRSPCLIFRTTLGWLLPWHGRAFSTVCRFGICGRHRSSGASRRASQCTSLLPRPRLSIVLSSTGLFPPHSPTQYALSSSLFSLQFFLLLLSPTPSSCTLSSHRFESSYLPPPFPPHCNPLLVASSPIHPPLPAMSSHSLRSSTHPCIHFGCSAVPPFSSHSPSPSLARPHSLSPSGSQSTSHTTILLSCLSSANDESPYPHIHV